MMVPDLTCRLGSLTLKNPLIAASGCFGYGTEYAEIVDLSTLGAIAVKGLFLSEREGHPPPRIVETPSGMLNAIGLQGIGVHRFVQEKMPELRERGAVVLVNICGTTLDEYVELARILSDVEGVAALELNISCPNIKEGGITFGCSLTGTFDVVSAVRQVTRLPVIPKLTPNVTDVASFARAAEEAGADAISLVNTFLAMVIDVETRRPKLSNIVGGLSGPAIRPIAVRMVYECRRAVNIPILGMGGIATELLGDRSFRVLPVTDLDAAELVRSLRTSPLLFGYRGAPQVDASALEDVLQRVARLAGDVPALAELDINPLIVSPEGAIAVDARARVAPVPPGPPPDPREGQEAPAGGSASTAPAASPLAMAEATNSFLREMLIIVSFWSG